MVWNEMLKAKYVHIQSLKDLIFFYYLDHLMVGL